MIVNCEQKANTGRESNKEGAGRGDAHLSSRTPLFTELKPKEVFHGFRTHTFYLITSLYILKISSPLTKGNWMILRPAPDRE